jgi:hypothetical protein
MRFSLDDPRISSVNKIAAGFVVTGKMAPVLPIQAQIPLGLAIVAGKFSSMYNVRVHDKEALMRHRLENIGASNYTPKRMKENLRLRW